METWYRYLDAWAGHRWLAVVAVLAVALVVAGIVGTALGDPLAFLFVPGLALAFVHHVVVGRVLG